MFEICDILSSYFSLTRAHVHFSIAAAYDRIEPIFGSICDIEHTITNKHQISLPCCVEDLLNLVPATQLAQKWPCTMQCNEISCYDTHLCWCWQPQFVDHVLTATRPRQWCNKAEKKKKKMNIGSGQISPELNQSCLWAQKEGWADLAELWKFCLRQFVIPTSEGSADEPLLGVAEPRPCGESSASRHRHTYTPWQTGTHTHARTSGRRSATNCAGASTCSFVFYTKDALQLSRSSNTHHVSIARHTHHFVQTRGNSHILATHIHVHEHDLTINVLCLSRTFTVTDY